MTIGLGGSLIILETNALLLIIFKNPPPYDILYIFTYTYTYTDLHSET